MCGDFFEISQSHSWYGKRKPGSAMLSGFRVSRPQVRFPPRAALRLRRSVVSGPRFQRGNGEAKGAGPLRLTPGRRPGVSRVEGIPRAVI